MPCPIHPPKGLYSGVKKSDGTSSSALIGADKSHWSYLLDSSASLMYGNAWQDNGNGTFTSIAIWDSYSALDLYFERTDEFGFLQWQTLLQFVA